MSRDRTATSVLLVTPPGATEEALRAALASIAGVEMIEVVAGHLAAAHAMRSLAPDVVLISGQIPSEEIVTLIELVGDEPQGPQVIVLSSSQGLERHFLTAGAFAVLAPWDPVNRLQALIGRRAQMQARAEVNGNGMRA